MARATVGVDIERMPRPERVELCRPALHPEEERESAGVPARDRPALFARLWARKKACLKGTGEGVGGWTSAVYLGDEGPGTPPRPQGWSVLDVPYGPDHMAAAAIRGPVPRAAVHRLPAEAVPAGGRMPDSRTAAARTSLPCS
ncbi:4'-phosphopantetheinyl transferase superfamily protein [Streptomyces sp. MMCC 100]|uniref:4'-phosphopantetheinyl transferase family protein n=1 Tax=Streptomyces sp. MMCC 100 TaxID=3163555 RepID=UPI0035992D08